MRKNEVIAAMQTHAYREDTKGEDGARIDCLYYNVAETDSQSLLVQKIENFLRENEPSLRLLNRIKNVDFKNLDIGLTLKEESASLSVELGSKLICHAAELGLSITVSVYKASSCDTVPTK